ncbi:MAG: hypothetical protein FJ088_06715 [Deltaproteobacteria bacterium]|nr:hypothetical protein [Deltaproteobacteria bacterium]
MPVRIKIIGLFAGMILLLCAAVALVIQTKSAALKDDFKSSLKSKFQTYSEIRGAREYTQRLLGLQIGKTEIAGNLAVLTQMRDEMSKIEKEAYDKYPEKSGEHGRMRELFIENYPFFIENFTSNLISALEKTRGAGFLKEAEKANFMTHERNRVRLCLAIGVDQCFWEYTYNPLQDVLARDLKFFKGYIPSVVIISDNKGIGITDSTNAKWSNQTNFADKFSLVGEALKGQPATDVVFRENTQKHLFATAVPIFYDGKVVGSVVVGDEIGDKLISTEKGLIDVEIVYLKGTEPLYSSLSSQDTSKVVRKNEEDFISATFKLAGFFSENSLQVILAKKKDDVLNGLKGLTGLLILFIFIFVLLGLLLTFYLFREFIKPFEQMDQGIHEVINGNFDYQFAFDYKEDLPRSIAQSLNLMSLILQGKPLPEEEEEEGQEEWKAGLLIDETTLSSKMYESGMLAPGKDSGYRVSEKELERLSSEPAESYYRRIYNEYLKAREDLNLSVKEITYQKFKEKVVRNEMMLKEKYGGRAVRFIVNVKEGTVFLVPVQLK